jgi:nucleotide-binding universal stress UspA family protein
MPRVLVPLDGSDESAAILPDAVRLAGVDGEIILIHDVNRPVRVAHDEISPEARAVETSGSYLEGVRTDLALKGANARTETFVMSDAAYAIDEAARMFEVDMVACATHARSGWDRILHPSVAWKALAHSPVPVYLKRVTHRPAGDEVIADHPPRIMVPLDGSARAEAAAPYATALARQLGGRVLLAEVVPQLSSMPKRFRASEGHGVTVEAELKQARAYLEEVAGRQAGHVEVAAVEGAVVATLMEMAGRLGITHIVMASHGRTGLQRMLMGSIADELIHALEIPLIVLPAFAGRPDRMDETHEATEAVATH